MTNFKDCVTIQQQTDFIRETLEILGFSFYPYQYEYIRRLMIMNEPNFVIDTTKPPITKEDLKTLVSMEIVEAITSYDQCTFTFKLRRLPGKDYIAEFKKLSNNRKDSVNYESRPCKSYYDAIREVAMSLIEKEGWDNEPVDEPRADTRLASIFRGAQSKEQRFKR